MEVNQLSPLWWFRCGNSKDELYQGTICKVKGPGHVMGLIGLCSSNYADLYVDGIQAAPFMCSSRRAGGTWHSDARPTMDHIDLV